MLDLSHKPTMPKIISGAQTGADLGGLLAAESLGLQTGGWVPRNCCTDEGFRPELISRFGLQDSLVSTYARRTILNQRDSDCTIWFGRTTSPGARLTIGSANGQKKPIFILRPTPFESFSYWGLDQTFRAAQEIMNFLLEQQPTVLNIAGNRESTHPGICAFVQMAIKSAFAGYAIVLNSEETPAP